MLPQKLITHNGTFHADEVFAIAILEKLIGKPLEITRTRDAQVLEAGVKNTDVFVVDVGLAYEPEKFNFDHHQDRNMKSAAGLVWQHFGAEVCGGSSDAAMLVQEAIIDLVDQTDTNQNNILMTMKNHLPGGTDGTVSGLLGAFNRETDDEGEQMQQFRKAIAFAATFLENSIYEAALIVAQKPIWDARKMLKSNVVRLEQHCKGWKKWAARESQIQFCLIPRTSLNNAVEGQQWQITSIDAVENPLPTLEEMQAQVNTPELIEFAHKARFLAVFNDEQTAMEVVDLL